MKAIHLGYWFAILAILFGMIYSIVQICSAMGIIDTPYDKVGMFLPSLMLAPCFLIVIICLHENAGKATKVLTLTSICFSVLYTGLVSLVYFSQLASVLPLQFKNNVLESELLFTDKSFMVAIDCIGYGYMSIAAFFMSFAYKKHKWLFRSLLFHGLLAPVIIASFFFPVLLFFGALWMISFPWAMVQALLFFKNKISKTAMVYSETLSKKRYKDSFENHIN